MINRVRPGSRASAGVGAFNQFVALDMFYLRDASRTQFTLLSVLDLSGLLHVVTMTESRSAKHLLELFGLMWMSWAGTPESFYVHRPGHRLRRRLRELFHSARS